MFAPVFFDDPRFRFLPYDPLLAYGQSEEPETALFAVGATRHWAADEGIVANAVMPGAIATGLQRHTGGLRTPVERRKSPSRARRRPCSPRSPPRLKASAGGISRMSRKHGSSTNELRITPASPPTRSSPPDADLLWALSVDLLAG